jgi:hypothetical protein
MLAQDSLGYVHEVPDPGYGYGLAEYPDGSVGEVPMALDGYGGYGSPMGLPFLAPLAAALAPMAAQAVSRFLPGAAQAVGRAVGGIIPGALQAAGAAGRLIGQGMGAFRQGFNQGGMVPTPWGPRPAMPGMPGMPGMPSMPGMPGMPMPFPRPGFYPRPFFRAPAPVGWVTPALPFTGSRPRRMYLRCAAWPGPTGLVPAFANQALPPPGMPGAPGMPVPGGARRRRRRGRR